MLRIRRPCRHKFGAGVHGHPPYRPERAVRGRPPVAMTVLLPVLLLAGCQMAHIAPDPDDPDPEPEPASAAAGTETGAESRGVRVSDASATEADAALQFTVSPGQAYGETVTVSYATADGSAVAGEDYRAVSGTLTFLPGTAGARNVEVPIIADSLAEVDEVLELRLHDARGAPLAAASATGTIVDDDQRAITVEPPAIVVREGSGGSYRVALTSEPSGVVTVTAASASSELSVDPARFSFAPSDWRDAHTVAVAAARDADGVADAPVAIRHTVSGGGYDGVVAEVQVTIVEADAATLAIESVAAPEDAGMLSFEVTMSVAHGSEVRVDYATAGRTATAGEDYTETSGTLTLAAGSTLQAIEVAVLGDALDEPDEQFAVVLSNATVQLAGGGETLAATGTIEDDDPAPRLSIADESATEGAGDGVMRFQVDLDGASGRTVTVSYATADQTAVAEADYTSATGVLTFAPGTVTGTVPVAILDDEHAEAEETFTMTLSGARNATLSPAAAATGTIADNGDPEPHLTSLQVAGAGTMYPPFDSGTLHYALPSCSSSTVLTVKATAAPGAARLTILHADETRNQAAIGALDTVTVNVRNDLDVSDVDVVIDVTDPGGAARYVVHCLPEDFPTIKVLQKAADVADGFLYVSPLYTVSDTRIRYAAVLDNNGVPRFHRGKPGGRIFGPVRYPLTVHDQEVKYIQGRTLLSSSFAAIHNVQGWRSFSNNHEFRATDSGNIIEVQEFLRERDFSDFTDSEGNPYGTEQTVHDTVIREHHPVSGDTSFYWNSWTSKNREAYKLSDCQAASFPGVYAMVNSLQIVDGDVVASSRSCGQVWRINRSDGSGDIEWKIGGTDPGPDSDTRFLPIANDEEGEFCGQHSALLTSRETVMLFDNGVHCHGPRKSRSRLTRVVEYDISSGTQAVLINHYGLPKDYGVTDTMGSVEELEEGRWLIAWGNQQKVKVGADRTIAVSEVAPVSVAGGASLTSGKVYLHLHMSKDGKRAATYRAHRGPEVDIPLNLP